MRLGYPRSCDLGVNLCLRHKRGTAFALGCAWFAYASTSELPVPFTDSVGRFLMASQSSNLFFFHQASG